MGNGLRHPVVTPRTLPTAVSERHWRRDCLFAAGTLVAAEWAPMKAVVGGLVAIQAAVIVVLGWLWLTTRADLARANRDRVVASAQADSRNPCAVPGGPASRSDTVILGADEASSSDAVSQPEPENATPWSADDPVGIIVHGKVVDEAGNGIEMASVALEDSVGESASCDTARNGTFVIHGLHPGTWSVWVEAAAFAKFEAELALADAATRYRQDVVLRRSTLVFVAIQTLEGESLEGSLRHRIPDLWDISMTAVATAAPPGPRLGANRGDLRCLDVLREPEGLRRRGIEAPRWCSGYLDVGRAPPFSVSAVYQDAVLQTQEVKSAGEAVVFRIDPAVIERMLASVRLRIVDAVSGNPLSGARVELNPGHSSGSDEKTPADGRLVFENRHPGWIYLRVEATGRQSLEHAFMLAPGEAVDLGDVVLAPSTRIEGRLLTPEGRPVSGEVRLVAPEQSRTPQPWTHRAWSAGLDGSFAISDVGRGRHLLIGQDDANSHAATALVVDTSSGDVRGVDLRLKRGVNVTFDVDVAARERLIQLRDSDGAVLYSEFEYGHGGFSIPLAPGTYLATILDGTQEVKSQSVVVGSAPLRVRVAE
jgi:hypothetical protein